MVLPGSDLSLINLKPGSLVCLLRFTRVSLAASATLPPALDRAKLRVLRRGLCIDTEYVFNQHRAAGMDFAYTDDVLMPVKMFRREGDDSRFDRKALEFQLWGHMPADEPQYCGSCSFDVAEHLTLATLEGKFNESLKGVVVHRDQKHTATWKIQGEIKLISHNEELEPLLSDPRTKLADGIDRSLLAESKMVRKVDKTLAKAMQHCAETGESLGHYMMEHAEMQEAQATAVEILQKCKRKLLSTESEEMQRNAVLNWIANMRSSELEETPDS